MIEATFKKGDRVRHPSRPEWGTGTITKIEVVTRDQATDLRIWVRFPSVGEKTLLASAAQLEPAEDQGFAAVHARPTVTSLDVEKGGGWLGSISKRTPEELMSSLSDEATDPFVGPRRRFEVALALYRFDGSPTRLIEWAIAQSGLDDPLSRFNRQELEQLHKRWLFNLDGHVTKLLGDLRREQVAIDPFLAKAPPLAVKSVRRLQSTLR